MILSLATLTPALRGRPFAVRFAVQGAVRARSGSHALREALLSIELRVQGGVAQLGERYVRNGSGHCNALNDLEHKSFTGCLLPRTAEDSRGQPRTLWDTVAVHVLPPLTAQSLQSQSLDNRRERGICLTRQALFGLFVNNGWTGLHKAVKDNR